MSPDDYIQILNGEDLVVLDGWYSYLSADYAEGDESLIGWYDLNKGYPGDAEAKCDDSVTIKVGQAILGYIGTGLYPQFQSAGEAPTETSSVSSDGATYPFIANIIPRDIPLNWMIPAGITPDDYIQVLNGDNLSQLDGWYAYLSADYAEGDESLIGWYDLNKGYPGDAEAKCDDSVTLKAGDAFLGYLGLTGVTVDFQFPSSTKNVTK